MLSFSRELVILFSLNILSCNLGRTVEKKITRRRRSVYHSTARANRDCFGHIEKLLKLAGILYHACGGSGFAKASRWTGVYKKGVQVKRYIATSLLPPVVILIIMAVCVPSLHAADAPLKALLITGQNNHNWQLSHPILKTIVEDTGLFLVDIALTPPEGGDLSAFAPVFADYNVVILDYTGDPWPDATRQAFLDYVRGGGGVVVYHAADNAFPDWPEFNELIGLGGWGNRTEKHGPYVFWRDGELVRDMRPGPGGAHGKQHQYVVTHRVTDHPITNGLPETWLHEKDELYHHLRGPANNMTLLATAWSDPGTGGSGEHEPVLFTIAYGSGRVFHTVLGHAGDEPPPAMQCVGFIVTLQRGAEWAATGQVTQPVPDDFPTADRVRLRPQFKQSERKIPREEQARSRASVMSPAPN